jgi:hypothetical protein
MKQKPFITVKTPPYYIALGVKKVESSIRRVCGKEKEKEMLAKFDTYAKHYSALAKEGKITKDLERILVNKCLNTRTIESVGKTVHEKIGIYDTLTLLIELACYYGVMSVAFYEAGDLEQTTHYLIKAGEVHGMTYRLRPETRTAKQVLKQTTNEVEELWGHKYQILKKKTSKKISQKANAIKSAEYSAKIEFAKQRWLELPAWHDRTAKDTADKIIKEFSKSVPAKGRLSRLISEWKQQSKK